MIIIKNDKGIKYYRKQNIYKKIKGNIYSRTDENFLEFKFENEKNKKYIASTTSVNIAEHQDILTDVSNYESIV